MGRILGYHLVTVTNNKQAYVFGLKSDIIFQKALVNVIAEWVSSLWNTFKKH
jgi:hypothetical protein